MSQPDIKLFGVVGKPISHSLSPKIHNSWIETHHLKAFYAPLLIESEQNFEIAIKNLPLLGFCGVNITLPYKQIAYSICNELSAEARAIGAVNCLHFTNDKIIGYNTDAFGFLHPLQGKKMQNALVIGAGGASMAVIYALKSINCKVDICNRTFSEALRLAKHFNCNAIKTLLGLADLEKYDIIVNATSLGLKGEVIDVKYNSAQKTCIFYDIIYKNNAITPFLQNAKNNGNAVIDGLPMLYAQAAKSFEIWHGIMPTF